MKRGKINCTRARERVHFVLQKHLKFDDFDEIDVVDVDDVDDDIIV